MTTGHVPERSGFGAYTVICPKSVHCLLDVVRLLRDIDKNAAPLNRTAAASSREDLTGWADADLLFSSAFRRIARIGLACRPGRKNPAFLQQGNGVTEYPVLNQRERDSCEQ